MQAKKKKRGEKNSSNKRSGVNGGLRPGLV